MENSNINKTRNMTVCRFWLESGCYSEIRLRGKWLKDAGFESGQMVTITCKHRELIIRTDGSFKYPRNTKD